MKNKTYLCTKEKYNIFDHIIFREGIVYEEVDGFVVCEDTGWRGPRNYEEYLKEVTTPQLHLPEPDDRFVVSVFLFGALFGASIVLIINSILN